MKNDETGDMVNLDFAQSFDLVTHSFFLALDQGRPTDPTRWEEPRGRNL